MNKVQVLDKRDTLAKIAYNSLFVWLVHCVNRTISADINDVNKDNEDDYDNPSDQGRKKIKLGFIGVLDI